MDNGAGAEGQGSRRQGARHHPARPRRGAALHRDAVGGDEAGAGRTAAHPARRRGARGRWPRHAGPADRPVPQPLTAPRLTARVRLSLALLWLAALLVAGWLLAQRLELGGDLRSFMPSAETPAQKLLLDELGEGPGSRLLLLALSGDDAETLAAQSRGLREQLSVDARFTLVANGDASPDAFPERLRPYRYLLSPTLDAKR